MCTCSPTSTVKTVTGSCVRWGPPIRIQSRNRARSDRPTASTAAAPSRSGRRPQRNSHCLCGVPLDSGRRPRDFLEKMQRPRLHNCVLVCVCTARQPDTISPNANPSHSQTTPTNHQNQRVWQQRIYMRCGMAKLITITNSGRAPFPASTAKVPAAPIRTSRIGDRSSMISGLMAPAAAMATLFSSTPPSRTA